jgi:uncharacterized protein (DUF342 family)
LPYFRGHLYNQNMAEAPHPGAPSEEKSTPGATNAPAEAAKSAAAGKPATLPVGGAGDYLEIKVEPMRAILTIHAAIANTGMALTREDVAKKLQALKVVKGVDWPAVDRMIQGKQYDRGQIIAQGQLAKAGRDAVIRELIKVDSDLSPLVKKDGKADYKNVDNIHQVKQGDVLAVKEPMVAGEPGEDILGKVLPAAAVKDAQFKLGANTAVSPDGLNLVATVGGFVYHNAGALSVGVTYTLKGDVDFHTGNLHYHGDIQVLGNVTEGFTVEADGNITVEGTVEGAEVVSHGGAVEIKGCVFGHGKGRVAAKTGIRLLAAQDVRIECPEGPVEVAKSMRSCQVTAMHVRAGKAGCSVMGGEIRAYGEVEIADLGGEGCHTHILILDKAAEEAKVRLKLVDKALAGIPLQLEPVEKKLMHMKAMVAKYGAVLSEKVRSELKAVADAYSALKKAEKDLEGEKARLGAVMATPGAQGGKFAITDIFIWGGILEFYGHARELEAEDAKKEWIWAIGGLQARSLIPAPQPNAPQTPSPEGATPS